jgi:hypothetical protein
MRAAALRKVREWRPEMTKGHGLSAVPFVYFCLAVAYASAACLTR